MANNPISNRFFVWMDFISWNFMRRYKFYIFSMIEKTPYKVYAKYNKFYAIV